MFNESTINNSTTDHTFEQRPDQKSEPENTIVNNNEKINPIQNRRYNLGGCFNLIGTVVAHAERPDPEAPISLSRAWMPLSSIPVPKTEGSSYRHPGIIPSTSDRSFRRIAPAIDAFASERNWVVQPVAFAFRPAPLDDILGEDGRISTLLTTMQDYATEDRVMIDTQAITENQAALKGLIEICMSALSESKVPAPAYMKQLSGQYRSALGELLADMPFLVHHIFRALPNLHLLRHRARINGREDTVQHLRYDPQAIMDINHDRLLRPLVINVVP